MSMFWNMPPVINSDPKYLTPTLPYQIIENNDYFIDV